MGRYWFMVSDFACFCLTLVVVVVAAHTAFGLRHWMEHALGMNPDTMEHAHKHVEDGIVILMDPDMILLRPITHDYSDVDNHLWAEEKTTPATRVVRHGFPMAQQDGYLANNWMNLDAEYIFNKTKDEHQPIPKGPDGPLHWNTGPPYLATVRTFDNQQFNLGIWTPSSSHVNLFLR